MTEYTLDPETVDLRFRARGMWGAVPVSGVFRRATGHLTWVRGTTGTIEIEVDADSIDTGNRLRDRHLRAVDFFHTARFPTITFRGDVAATPGGVRLLGSLTVRGQEVPHDVYVSTTEGAATMIGEASTSVDLNAFGIAPPLRMTRRAVHLELYGSFHES